MVLCEDGSDAVVKVAAVDRHLKVILDEFVTPNKPVVDYRTTITGITAEDLENATTLSVVDIQPLKRKEIATTKRLFFFNSPAEANQAFENIAGVLGKDLAGLPQKQVFLNPSSPLGPTVYVRKMLKDDSVEDVSATKRSFPEDPKVICKKQKRDYDSEGTREADVNQCKEEKTEEKTEKLREDAMIKEIEELKQKLKEQDKMINDLKKQLRKQKRQSRVMS